MELILTLKFIPIKNFSALNFQAESFNSDARIINHGLELS
jgi:hypothetical protein